MGCILSCHPGEVQPTDTSVHRVKTQSKHQYQLAAGATGAYASASSNEDDYLPTVHNNTNTHRQISLSTSPHPHRNTSIVQPSLLTNTTAAPQRSSYSPKPLHADTQQTDKYSVSVPSPPHYSQRASVIAAQQLARLTEQDRLREVERVKYQGRTQGSVSVSGSLSSRARADRERDREAQQQQQGAPPHHEHRASRTSTTHTPITIKTTANNNNNIQTPGGQQVYISPTHSPMLAGSALPFSASPSSSPSSLSPNNNHHGTHGYNTHTHTTHHSSPHSPSPHSPSPSPQILLPLPAPQHRYQLSSSILGKGHFARVTLAYDTLTHTKVAVKIIDKKEMVKNRAMVESEMIILQKMGRHRHIVSLLDYYEDERKFYLVMDLCAGGDLFSKIVEYGKYTELQAIRCCRQIAEALQYIHNCGITHRDLKPENILLVTDDINGDLKIADFGLSKILAHTDDVMRTVCGTWAYCAPEVINHSHYTSLVDNWTLGVLMYILLCGYHPFDCYGNLAEPELLEKIMAVDYEFDDAVWLEVSEEAKALIRGLLQYEPSRRLSLEEYLESDWIQSDPTLSRSQSHADDHNRPERSQSHTGGVEEQGGHHYQHSSTELLAPTTTTTTTNTTTSSTTVGTSTMVAVADKRICTRTSDPTLIPMRLQKLTGRAFRALVTAKVAVQRFRASISRSPRVVSGGSPRTPGSHIGVGVGLSNGALLLTPGAKPEVENSRCVNWKDDGHEEKGGGGGDMEMEMGIGSRDEMDSFEHSRSTGSSNSHTQSTAHHAQQHSFNPPHTPQQQPLTPVYATATGTHHVQRSSLSSVHVNNRGDKTHSVSHMNSPNPVSPVHTATSLNSTTRRRSSPPPIVSSMLMGPPSTHGNASVSLSVSSVSSILSEGGNTMKEKSGMGQHRISEEQEDRDDEDEEGFGHHHEEDDL